jgi:hypothetical protein
MDYHFGLGKIYTQEEIDKAMQSPGFEREYGLQYLGLEGDIFSPLQIERAVASIALELIQDSLLRLLLL